MPGLDNTGPEGKGPKTGRGLGNCGKNTKSLDKEIADSDKGLGRNLRRRSRMRGKGVGQGNRNRYRGGQEE